MYRPTAQLALSANLRKLALPLAVVAFTAGATNAFGGSPSLVAIPLLGSAANNWGMAITPDGLWVAGYSDDGTYPPYNLTPGFLYNVSAGTAVTAYNAPVGGQILNPVTGICYRTYAGQQEIILAGLAAGWDSSFNTTNGTAFGLVDRYSYGGSSQRPEQWLTNMRAAGGGDSFFDVWWDVHSSLPHQVRVGKFSGPWVAALTPTPGTWDTAPANSTIQACAISGTGRAVGYQNDPHQNYVWDWTGTGTATAWTFIGLDGVSDSGEAYAVSANGTIIFGRSADPNNSANPAALCGYKATFNSTMPGPATQLSINPLPNYPDVDFANTTLATVYGCTADGKYAVGMDYRRVERAVLWDTSSPNSLYWTVLDLMDFATAQGILTNFTSLDRAYNVGVSAAGDFVITGTGTLDGATRAFVLTVPKPLSAYSVWPPALRISASPAKYTLSFNSITNTPDYYNNFGYSLTNYLDYTTALSNPPGPSTWTTLLETQVNGSLTTVVDPNPPDRRRFYRLRTQ
jgi:hypothetical protein